MPIRFLLDEHFRGVLYAAILRHTLRGGLPIDATRVGDPSDLPRGSSDPAILAWAERNDRIVVTHDSNTMIGDLTRHLAAGNHSPGLFVVKRGASLGQIVAFLELATHAGDSADYADRVTFIP